MLISVIFTIFTLSEVRSSDEQALKYASDYILEGLNPNVKPCDNLYDFMCDKWVEKLSKNETYYNYENDNLLNKTDTILLAAVKMIDVNDKQTPTYKIWLKNFFDQCVNNNATFEETMKQIFNGIQRVIGPPPMLTMDPNAKALLMKRKIWNLVGQIQRNLNEGVFFRTTVGSTMDDCDKQQPILSFDLLWVSDATLNETEIKENIILVSKIFGLTLDKSETDKKVQKMIDFDNEVKNYTSESLQDADYYDQFTADNVSQLIAYLPSIDWEEFFEGLFSTDQLNYWDKNQAKIQLSGKKYFQKIDQIVNKYDIETVFNMLFYKSVAKQFLFASLTESSAYTEINCIQMMRWIQSAASMKVYFEYIKHDPLEWKSDRYVIVDNIFSAFKSLISKTEWLSVRERAAIFKKMNDISFISPIPEYLNSVDEVEKVTIKFEANRGFYDNMVNMEKRAFFLDLDRYIMNSPSQRSIQFFDGTDYGSYEISTQFLTVLPPLYHFNYPLAVKYGVFGTKIATALLQGFTEDYLHEKWGTESWLNESNVVKLQDQLNCLDTQITLQECPADAVCPEHDWSWNYTLKRLLKEIDAMKVSYTAFKMSTKNTTDVPLTGLNNYNEDQIFLLAAGRSLCQTYIEDSVEDGGLSTNKNRLVKIFRNFPTFGKTFQCSYGSSYVEKPCGVWGSVN